MLKPNEYSDDDKLVCPIEKNMIYNIGCLEGMKQLEENSIDLIVTDPPYQLSGITKPDKRGDTQPFARPQGRIKGFMGKEWDVLPKQEIWNEMFRVLKSGAFTFIMMTPRQDSSWRTMAMLEQAGFQISFTPLYWAYASGFPKASNISKMVDKKMDKQLFVGITGFLSWATLFACSGIYFLDRELWVLMIGLLAFVIWVLMMVIDDKSKKIKVKRR